MSKPANPEAVRKEFVRLLNRFQWDEEKRVWRLDELSNEEFKRLLDMVVTE